MNTVMRFNKPAEKWVQSLPLGNGHIGCVINSDPFCDTLSINDDTLWSGYKRDYTKKDFKKNMHQVRSLMLEGKRAKAEEKVEENLTNRFTQAFMPFGDITIESRKDNIAQYIRELRMSEGIAYANYIKNGNMIQTQTFVSYPDDVLIHKIESQAPENYEIRFQSPLKHSVLFDEKGFSIYGVAPSDIIIGDVGNFYSNDNMVMYDETNKATKIYARAQIVCDGHVIAYSDRISVQKAKKILLVFACATNFGKGKRYKFYAKKSAEKVSVKAFESIKKTHIDDHRPMFNRMSIDLGRSDKTAGEDRYLRMKKGEIRNSDIELLFNYGRYLLIGASRTGSEAANLQGIWNMDLIPPWWSGYTLNINLQMNYWLADRTNLSDCFEPLVNYVLRLCKAGRRTAKKDYGTKGSVAHHQSDIWAHTTPVGHDLVKIPSTARWMMWNMALPWLCVQLFEHYKFTQDEQYLKKELLPIMKDVAIFMMRNFTEIDGRLYNVPSTSPENMYIGEEGKPLALCNISAMDIGIAKEFFEGYIFACRKIGDKSGVKRFSAFVDKLAEYSVSKQGVLLEWDKEYEEFEMGHRHFSMLFGVYPASHLLNSEYEEAAKKSLLRRLENGSGQTGWSAVWAITLLARFGEGEAAYDIIKKLMKENIHENFFGGHPPNLFQIDANYGFTAAICELILQEYDGMIRLLPALPKAMKSGKIEGIKIYSGHIISMRWDNAKVTSLEIDAAVDDTILISINDLVSDNAIYSLEHKGTRIVLEKGETYRFYFSEHA